MRRTRILTVVVAVLATQGAPAQAASSAPFVVYTANSNVAGPVVLRANPATGAVSEVSRNGRQGGLFVHPYDVAVEPGGSLVVVDMGAFVTDRRTRAPDGAVIRVDPASGRQTLVSRGGALIDPAGIAIGPGGFLYVVENVGVNGSPGVIRINPVSGAQTHVAQGGDLCNPFGVAAEPGGTLIVTDYGDLLGPGGTPLLDCEFSLGSVVRVPTDGRAPTVLSQGNLFGSPFGVAVEPGGRIVVANEKAVAGGLVAVDPRSGYQSALTANLAGDALRFPQRVARAPDGSFLVTDYQLTDGNGGIVGVAPGGGQRVLWRGRPFDNPVGIAVVGNRPPRATLTVAPEVVPGGDLVGFDASGSSDPEGRRMSYEWDLDGNGAFEVRSDSPTVARRYDTSAALTVRVRVEDQHGAAAQAAAALTVDATAPALRRFRVSSRKLLGRASRRGGGRASAATARRPPRKIIFRYRLSERARVAVAIARARPGRRVAGRCRRARAGRWARRPACTRWVRQITLRQLGAAGPNALRFRGKVRGRRLPAGRYRATATGADRVGNPSAPDRIRLRVVAPSR